MVSCAIILAAGQNRRMGDHVDAKAALPIGGETFMSRHIRLLRGHGVTRIFVIASQRSVRSLERYQDAEVTVVVSPYTGLQVGSSLTVLCGLEAVLRLGPPSDTLVMDADIIYEDALLEAVVRDSSHSSCLFAIDKTRGDLEEVLVYGRRINSPVLLGKGLSTGLTAGLTLIGESLGMIYLTASEVGYCRDLIRWIAGSPPGVTGYGYSGPRSEHEEIWQYLFSLRRLRVRQLPAELLFAECDTPEDYRYLCECVLPAIEQRRESGNSIMPSAKHRTLNSTVRDQPPV